MLRWSLFQGGEGGVLLYIVQEPEPDRCGWEGPGAHAVAATTCHLLHLQMSGDLGQAVSLLIDWNRRDNKVDSEEGYVDLVSDPASAGTPKTAAQPAYRNCGVTTLIAILY